MSQVYSWWPAGWPRGPEIAQSSPPRDVFQHSALVLSGYRGSASHLVFAFWFKLLGLGRCAAPRARDARSWGRAPLPPHRRSLGDWRLARPKHGLLHGPWRWTVQSRRRTCVTARRRLHNPQALLTLFDWYVEACGKRDRLHTPGRDCTLLYLGWLSSRVRLLRLVCEVLWLTGKLDVSMSGSIVRRVKTTKKTKLTSRSEQEKDQRHSDAAET